MAARKAKKSNGAGRAPKPGPAHLGKGAVQRKRYTEELPVHIEEKTAALLADAMAETWWWRVPVKPMPPDRVLVSWCANCGSLGFAVERGGKIPVDSRGGKGCCAASKARAVRYQLAARRGQER